MNNIQSIDRAADIIEYIGSCERGATLSEITLAVSLPKTTTHRFLKSLLEKGFLDYNPETSKYQIGVKFFVLGRQIAPYDALMSLIVPIAQKMHAKFDEVINVSMLYGLGEHGYNSTIVHKEQNYNRVLSANPMLGRTNDCHCSSVGKCLLAFSDKVDLQLYRNIPLRRFTNNTITDYETLCQEVELVRKQGYAIDNEEQEDQLFCIGVPILLRNGRAIAAMSVSGWKPDIMAKNPEAIIRELVKMSQQLKQQLPNSLDDIIR